MSDGASVRVLEEPSRKPMPRRTVLSDRMTTQQRSRVLLLNVVPALGVAVAIVLASLVGVRGIDVALLVGMYVVTGLGITVGYHRLLTHRSFSTGPRLRALLAIAGSMAGQGPPLYWAANHRRHHQYSDEEGDPHSPRPAGRGWIARIRGLYHAHLGWLFEREITNSWAFAKDLHRDAGLRWVNRYYLRWLGLGILAPSVVGGLADLSIGGFFAGAVWGGLARLFFSVHSGYLVNSVTHAFGSRPFETGDESRNHALVALATLGEGWHNNHHAFPTSANFGLRWWQIDLGYLFIRCLERLGLVWNVRLPEPVQIRADS